MYACSERNLEWALESIDRMLTRVSDERLNELPWAGPVRLALLEDALVLYRTLLAEQESNQVLRRRVGQAYRRLGKYLLDLARMEEAAEAAQSAIKLHLQLADEDPGNLDHQYDLSDAIQLQALVLSETGQLAEAIASTSSPRDPPMQRLGSDWRFGTRIWRVARPRPATWMAPNKSSGRRSRS